MRLCSAIDRYLVNLARHRIGRSFEAVLFQQFHYVINRSILVSLHRTNLQKQRNSVYLIQAVLPCQYSVIYYRHLICR
jgi:hypothetical protein